MAGAVACLILWGLIRHWEMEGSATRMPVIVVFVYELFGFGGMLGGAALSLVYGFGNALRLHRKLQRTRPV